MPVVSKLKVLALITLLMIIILKLSIITLLMEIN